MGGGRWIALEGGEGTGKSTQARRLADTLGAVLTREPGGTAVGARIRDVLLDPAVTSLDARAEALLMAADRAEHLAVVVAPALDAGRTVVSDRSAWSSLAYQGYGRGLDLAELHQLSEWAMRGRWPDLVVLVEVASGEVSARLAAAGRSADRLEAEGGGFHERVRDGFRALAADSPDRWVVVDGAGSEDEVSDRIQAAVLARLGDVGARHHA
ncbi:MAG TPA: dTMP kinase [Acidimicrobiia bacterium]|jgi:dTMP kinase|nr:dTMP kinase [Acidimicrobiia bacterium]HWW45453.1 dTMP kinase [Acidimicrobiia bacterium]